MPDDAGIEAYYIVRGPNLEFIRIMYGDLTEGEYLDLDIRDALFFQWQLAGAIEDYTKAVGK